MIPVPLQYYSFILKGVGILIFCLSAWYVWHSFTGHYKEIGRQEISAELKPKIDNLEAEKKTLKNSYAMLGLEVEKQNKQVQELKQVSERYAQKAVQAEKKAKAIAEHMQEKINAAESSPVAATCEDAVREAQARL